MLASLPLLYAWLSTRWEWENSLMTWSIAVILCLAGIAVRGWASDHCNYAAGKERRLASTGPYALVRNPLYVGNLLIIAAATFASELIWFVPISVMWAWGVYQVVSVRYEERKLTKWYGEAYRPYRLAVPPWIPTRRAVPSVGAVPWQALVTQSPRLIFLLPFVLKELRLFGLGSG